MKVKRIASIVFCALLGLAVLTPASSAPRKKDSAKKAEADSVKISEYDKIFDGKKCVTASDFMKLHLVEGNTVIAELPKDILGRDILVSTSVEKTSSPDVTTSGYISPKTLHVSFEATDSLVILKEVDAYRYRGEGLDTEIGKSHIGAIMKIFPIKTQSPDSTSLVFDVTSLFSEYDKRLNPADPLGAGSFGGLISTILTHTPGLSSTVDVQANEGTVSVLRNETYSMKQSFLGMSVADDGGSPKLTLLQRKSLILLPEETAAPRIADSRIGVTAVSRIDYSASDRGSRTKWYARRWNLKHRDHITFYVDTLFNEEMYSSISKGILVWNEAFESMGRGQVLEVRRYPSDDPCFDANDPRRCCVRYDASTSEILRYNVWTDPRSGEIFGASISIPMDVLLGLHTSVLAEISVADPDVRTVKHNIPACYEALTAKVANAIGHCLGLDQNLAASGAYPADSLRSPSFTKRYGLSPSIMDMLPYNFFATEGDKERGVTLIQTGIGAYDKYAINWLYCDIPGAVTPEQELPYLDKLIAQSKSDPHCLYVRQAKRSDPRFSMDPRPATMDLGDDPIRCALARKENYTKVLKNLGEWLKDDVASEFIPYMNIRTIENGAYPVMDLMKYVGGIYVNEIKDCDSLPSFEFVPAELQEKALRTSIEWLDDMTWLDGSDAWKDLILVNSFADYIQNLVIPELGTCLPKLAFAEEMGFNDFSVIKVYDTIIEYAKESIRANKVSMADNIMMHYFLVSTVMSRSSINPTAIAAVCPNLSAFASQWASHSSRADLTMGFTPMAAVSFQTLSVNDYRVLGKLHEIRDLYAKAATKTRDAQLKMQYEYFVMAIDRALKID